MANLTDLKKLNRSRVLEFLRMKGASPRAVIADSLGLDRKSLTNLASELLEEGLVCEVGMLHTAHGRPLILLDLKNDCNWVIGIHVSENQVYGVVINLHGTVQYQLGRAYTFDGPLKEVRETIRSVYQDLRHFAGSRLKATALTVPGILDTATGTIIRSVNIPSLSGMDLRTLLPEKMAEPFCFGESSRAKALAELWFGRGRNHENFVTVDLGIGIGAGIVTDGKVQPGPYIGELGHVVIAPEGRLCRCGHRGCLEAYLSERVVLSELNQGLESHWNSLADVPGTLPPIGDRLLKEAGHRLGLGLAALINILCPPLVILNGELTRYQAILLPAIEAGLEEAALPSCRRQTSVCCSMFGRESGAIGAAAIAASRVLV